MSKNEFKLDRKRQIGFLLHHLKGLHPAYIGQDQNRMTIVFFSVSGLDILGALELIENKKDIIEWIYLNQITSGHPAHRGFVGSPYLGDPSKYEGIRSHVTMTYCALVTLTILGDDLSRVDKKGIVEALKYLQNENGSFRPVYGIGETDVRFAFCACCVSSILNDWSGINKKKLANYLFSCRRYDAGFGHVPNGESHSGSSFCVISALFQIDEIKNINEIERLKMWYFNRHRTNGFNGRPNKKQDTCYTFWIGAALSLIGCVELVEEKALFQFVLQRQHYPTGGISKHIDCKPDILHTYLSLSGLSILGHEGLNEVYPALNITKRSLRKLDHFKNI